jgi:hypothetical protein
MKKVGRMKNANKNRLPRGSPVEFGMLSPFQSLLDKFFEDSFPFFGRFSGHADEAFLREEIQRAAWKAIKDFDGQVFLNYSRHKDPAKRRRELAKKQANPELAIFEQKTKLILDELSENWVFGWDKAGIPITDELIYKFAPIWRDIINRRLPAGFLRAVCKDIDDLMADCVIPTIKALRDFDYEKCFTCNFSEERKRIQAKHQKKGTDPTLDLARLEKKIREREAEKRSMDPAVVIWEAKKGWVQEKCDWEIWRDQYENMPTQTGCQSLMSLNAILASNNHVLDHDGCEANGDISTEENAIINSIASGEHIAAWSVQVEADMEMLLEAARQGGEAGIRAAYADLPLQRRKALEDYMESKDYAESVRAETEEEWAALRQRQEEREKRDEEKQKEEQAKKLARGRQKADS